MTTPKLFFSLLFSCIIVIISCEKEDENDPLFTSAIAPVARAGADTMIVLSACNDRVRSVNLDGSQSFDPENDIAFYRWQQIDSPGPDTLLYSTNAQAMVVNLAPGYRYRYELLVIDAGRRTARDTVIITVTAPVQAYDLDVTFSSVYTFTENAGGCGTWDYGCHDFTEIKAKGVFPSLGELSLHVGERADTASVSGVVNINIWDGRDKSLGGLSNVNFKKLIFQGGGTFNGVLNVTTSSAQKCDVNVVWSTHPLAITGNLDTATKAVTLSIKGKTYL